MFGNFIAERCQGTGATITLYGIEDNSIPFDAKFSDTNEVKYVIEDGDGIKKCGGTGTYNSGGTITRNDNWTWDGTTYDESPAGNIVLSGQTHIIRVAPLTTDINGWENKNSWSDPVDANIVPISNLSNSLGSSTKRFNTVYTQYIDINGNTNGNLIPMSNAINDLGSVTNKYKDLYLSGNITIDGTVDGRNVSNDGTKLDGIASGATANSTDAHLLNRANHTGQEAIADVNGLQATLDGKVNNAQEFLTLYDEYPSAHIKGDNQVWISKGPYVNGESEVVYGVEHRELLHDDIFDYGYYLERANHSGTQSISSINDFNITSPSVGDILHYNGSKWVEYSKSYALFRNGIGDGTTAIGPVTWKELSLQYRVIDKFTNDITSADSGKSVSFSKSRLYFLTADVEFNDISNVGRVQVGLRVEKWDGSSWTQVSGLNIKGVYVRGTGEANSVSSSGFVLIEAGNKIRLTAKVITGTSSGILQTDGGTNLTLFDIADNSAAVI